MFGYYEQRRTSRGQAALVPPVLFRIRTFSAGNAIALVFFAGNSGLFFLLPLQIQTASATRRSTRISVGYGIDVVGNAALPTVVIVAGSSMTCWPLRCAASARSSAPPRTTFRERTPARPQASSRLWCRSASPSVSA